MENVKNGFGKVDTTGMKECSPKWNLSNDVDLLKRLESFSQHVLNNTTYALSCMDSLEENLNKTFLNVRTITNNFHAIADNQFIENRVQEEEDTFSPPSDEVHSSMEWTSERSDLQINLNQSLKKCADILEKKFEAIDIPESDSEEDVGNGRQIMLIPRNVYKDRPLPHLIGSEGFMNDETLGLSLLQIEEDVVSESEDELVNHSAEASSLNHSETNSTNHERTQAVPSSVATSKDSSDLEKREELKKDEDMFTSGLLKSRTYIENGSGDNSEVDASPISIHSNIRDSVEPAPDLLKKEESIGTPEVKDFKADLARILSAGRSPVFKSPKTPEKIKPLSNDLFSPTTDGIFSPQKNDNMFSPTTDRTFSQPNTDNLFSPTTDRTFSQPNADNMFSQPNADNMFSQPNADNMFSQPNADNMFSLPNTDNLFSPTTDSMFYPPNTDNLFSSTTERVFTPPSIDRLFSPSNADRLFSPSNKKADEDIARDMDVDNESSSDLFFGIHSKQLSVSSTGLNKQLSIESVTTISQGSSDLPSVSTKVLHSLAKGRAKIQSKRRLPSRRHRKEGFNSSGPLSSNEVEPVNKPSTSSAILSPSTDEEDLFVLPAFDFQRDISSNNLFFGNTLLSPGVAIDAEKIESDRINVPNPSIDQQETKELFPSSHKNEIHDPLWSPMHPDNTKGDKFSWNDIGTSDMDNLFSTSSSRQETDSFTKSDTFSKGSLLNEEYKSPPAKTADNVLKSSESEDLFSSNNLMDDDEDDDFLSNTSGLFSKNSFKTSSTKGESSINLFKSNFVLDDDDGEDLFSSNVNRQGTTDDYGLFSSTTPSTNKIKDKNKTMDVNEDLFDDFSAHVKDPLLFLDDNA